VAVVRNTLNAPGTLPPEFDLSLAADIDPLCPFGNKAARFQNFFTEGLYLPVDLRKRKYQLRVTATVESLDEGRS
jgi:hypothetical protein